MDRHRRHFPPHTKPFLVLFLGLFFHSLFWFDAAAFPTALFPPVNSLMFLIDEEIWVVIQKKKNNNKKKKMTVEKKI